MVRRLKRKAQRRRRRRQSKSLEQRLKLPWFSLSARKTEKLREHLKNGRIDSMVGLFKDKRMAKSNSPIDRMIRYYTGRKYAASYQPVFDYVIDQPLSFRSLARLGVRGRGRAGVLRQLVSGRFDEQLPELVDLLGKKGRWAMVDYLHMFGYRGSSQLLAYSRDREHLKELIEYGYTVDYRLFKKLIQKFDLEIMIDEKEHFERLLDDRKSRPVLLKSISNLTPVVYRRLEENPWFTYGGNHLQAAVNRRNAALTLMMIDRFGAKLSPDQRKLMFNIPLVKKRWMRSIYYIRSPFTAENTADYRKLIEQLPKLPRGVLIRAVQSDSVELIDSIVRFESEFHGVDKKQAIRFIIRNDSRRMADKLIGLKLLAPIDFCRNEFLVAAIRHWSVEMLRYLLVDLRVICSPQTIVQQFPTIRGRKRRYRWGNLLSPEKAVEMIRVLVAAGVRLRPSLLDDWSESISLLRRLRPLNLEFGWSQYLYALRNGWFDSAAYLRREYEFNDRVKLSTILVSKRRRNYWSSFSWTTSAIRRAVTDFGVVPDRLSLKVAVEYGRPKIFELLIKRYGLKPDLKTARTQLLRSNPSTEFEHTGLKPVEKIVKRLVEDYGLDLSEVTPSKLTGTYRTDAVVKYLEQMYSPTYSVADLRITQLTPRIVELVFTRGLELTHEQFIDLSKSHNFSVVQAIARQPLSFKKALGRMELHRAINLHRGWWADPLAQVYLEEFGIEPSPYTLELILLQNRYSYSGQTLANFCLDRLEVVTERALNICPQPRWLGDGWVQIRQRIEKMPKIEYQPTEDECVGLGVHENFGDFDDLGDDDLEDGDGQNEEILEQLMAEM